MKVVCTHNDLSEMLLTGIHRDYFESKFGPKMRPIWQAEPGKTYTVYGISILRGYPFYWLALQVERYGRRWVDWKQVPSICFDIVDGRPSSLWHFKSYISQHRSDQVFVTKLAIKEWFDEPTFLERLVEDQAREVGIMTQAAAFMDVEFGG